MHLQEQSEKSENYKKWKYIKVVFSSEAYDYFHY